MSLEILLHCRHQPEIWAKAGWLSPLPTMKGGCGSWAAGGRAALSVGRFCDGGRGGAFVANFDTAASRRFRRQDRQDLWAGQTRLGNTVAGLSVRLQAWEGKQYIAVARSLGGRVRKQEADHVIERKSAPGPSTGTSVVFVCSFALCPDN